MDDARKTRAQLMEELQELRAQLNDQPAGSSERERALSSAPFEAILLSENGVGLDQNQTAERMFGYTNDEVVGRPATGWFVPADREKVMDNMRSGSEDTYEATALRKDGSTFPAEIQARMMDYGGRRVRVSSLKDITARREVEESLRQSKIRYRNLIRHSPFGIVTYDHNGDCKAANPAVARLIGARTEQLLAQNMFEISSWKASGMLPVALDALERKRICTDEFRMTTTFGNDIWTRCTFVPYEEEGNRHLMVVYEDLTECEHMRRALDDSERKYQTYVESAPNGIFVMDAGGQMLEVNEAACRLGGFTREQFLSMNARDFFPEEANEAGMENLQRLLIEGRFGADLLARQADGSRRWYHIEAVRLSEDRYIGFSIDIHDRIRAEGLLRQEKEKVQSYLDIAGVMLIALNPQGTVTLANRKACEVLGYAEQEILGKNWFDNFLPERFRTKVRDISRRILAGDLKPVEHYENPVLTRGGEERLIAWHNVVLPDENGHIAGHLASGEDVTEQRKATEALRLSEQRYRLLVETMHDGVAVLDRQGRFTYANKRLCELLGYDEDELIGLPARYTVNQENANAADRKMAERARGESGTYELEIVRRDGTKKHVIIAGRPLFDTDGNHAGSFATATDITERKAAERALRESEDKFRSITERSFDTIITADLDGLITYVSPAVERMLGYTVDQVVGRRVTDFAADGEAVGMRESIRRISRGESIEHVQRRLVSEGGSTITVEVSATPVVKGEEVTGLQIIMRDITETRRLQELESRAQRLETAGRIAGQVAHDFNNLLAPLMAYPDLIREEIGAPHPALDYLDDIEAAAQQIADINQQLLALGRRGHYSQESLNLNDLVRQAVRQLGKLPPALVVETELAPDLMNMFGGGSQIVRALTNVIHNARDAVKDVGRIVIRTENFYADDVAVNYGRVGRGEYVKLTVSDTGGGIAEDIAAKIFDPFFTTKVADKKRGSGLGLSVVDAVVKDHNGIIDLESVPGQGTSLYIYFPITRESEEPSSSPEIEGGHETVMVVDDDQVQREVTLRLLQRLGYEARSVASGEEAVEFLEENAHDLLMLDMIMPGGIDGTETYRRVLQFSPAQRAIIVSGFAESDRVKEALDLGVGAFLRKPLTTASLAIAVRKELDRSPRLAGGRQAHVPVADSE